MNKYRSIESSYKGGAFHWVGDGFRVMNFIPGSNDLAKRLNPFVLLDYNPAYYFPPTLTPGGVGAHPHRGFETVTIAYQGAVAHHDSAGHHGVINPGEVQWMTAGSGVLHKEYHEKEFASQGGDLQMVQLWVNLPKQYKMTAPRYQALEKNQMGRVELPNKQGTVNIIAGEYEGIQGPAKTFTPIHLLDVRLASEGQVNLSFPAHYNTAILLLEGEVLINQAYQAKPHELVVFDNIDGIILVENTTQSAMLLVLSAQPLHEPIAHYGPFVMNTQSELQQALLDYKSGKLGQLE